MIAEPRARIMQTSAWRKTWRDALVAAARAMAGVRASRNPGAWLMAAAKHRAIVISAATSCSIRHEELGRDLESLSGRWPWRISRPHGPGRGR